MSQKKLSVGKLQKVIYDEDFVFNGKEQCVFNGLYYNIVHDRRGKKNKFWIVVDGKPEYLLKYEMRDNDSLENAGQFLMTSILELLDVPHAEYYVTEFTRNNTKYEAILTKNYKKSKEDVEISGFGLIQRYVLREFDNNGIHVDFHHNVYDYIEVMKKLYSQKTIDYEPIKNTLLKYCLLQYVFMMSDLHFNNLSFSYDEKIGHTSLRVNEFYDCGNICCMTLSRKKMENNYNMLKKSTRIKNLIESWEYIKMPMFGVKTDLSNFYRETQDGKLICRPKCDEQTGSEQKKLVAAANLDILRSELAEEIATNEELRKFYDEIKALPDLVDIAKAYNNVVPDTIPEFCADFVQIISRENIRKLDIYINKKDKTQSTAKDSELYDFDFKTKNIQSKNGGKTK